MKETTKAEIEVMQDFIDGRPIQARDRTGSAWADVEKPLWNWQYFEYRTKKIKYTVHLSAKHYHDLRSASFLQYEDAEKFGKLMLNQFNPPVEWESYSIKEEQQ